MSFDYDKVKAKHEDAHGNSWTAYSDLFMMLSTVFLLLYVSVSLRSQTNGVAVREKMKQLAEKNSDLEQQLQVYNTLREQHMKTEASQQEQAVYEKLMSKLSLLQDEAKDERNKLMEQAKENEEKAYALNEYQRLIRNIINTNVLSKTQLQKKTLIIAKKDSINEEQRAVIEQQEEKIQATQAKIERAENELEQKIRALKVARNKSQISKALMEKKIAALRKASETTIAALEQKNEQAVRERDQKLQEFQAEAQKREAGLLATVGSLGNRVAQAQEEKNKADLARQLAEAAKNQAEFARGQAEADKLSAEMAKRQADLARGQAEAGRMRAEEERGRAEAERGRAEAERGRAEAERGRALASVGALQKDLKRMNELANAKKDLARRINQELKKAGLSGAVDEKTGDVTLAFGEEYFDAGSAALKPSMERILEKFMPGYSKSLFSDAKVAENIENVEIIGFASSTYKGRYVPPDSLKPQDQDAIAYNLKLSFNRADSIFRHIFNTSKMSFAHQRDLLPKIKVVGRGYLPEGKSGQDIPANLSDKEFCKRYNCNQAQKVVIKFKLKD